MATNYAADSVWGSDYQRAVNSGDQAYLQKVMRAIDARQPAGNQAGQIMANTVAQGRDVPVWANGAPSQQVNQLGQTRTAQAAQGWNVTPGTNGSLYNMRNQQPNQVPQTVGTVPQTANAYQTGYKPQGSYQFGGLLGGMRPQWNFGGSTMGNETHGMQSPYGYGQSPYGYGQSPYGQRGYASPYQTGYKGLLG